MGYLEYLPPGYGDGEPRPLLVFLHGGGEAGDGSEEQLALVATHGIPALIEAGEWPGERPFVILSPQYGPEPASGDCAIAQELHAFLNFATEHYEVDPSRIYLTGISCGAIGVWDYLADHGDEVVAVAVPISGHAEWALEESSACELALVPVWAFQGALDEVVTVDHTEGPMDQIRACDLGQPIEMELTVYPDADHVENDAWTRTYDLSAGHDIYTWMLEHSSD
jgi:predicted peptidase